MYSGNAVVVNFLMRWPWLVAPAAAIGVITVLPAPQPVPPPAPVPIVAPAPVPPAPLPPLVAKKVPPPLEVLCPPIEKTVKLSKQEKKVLIDKGCKVRG